MFSQVSVCPQGGCLPHCMLGYTPPPTTGRHLDPGQTPPGQTLPWADTPLCSACWDTINKWAVNIPLECILVSFKMTLVDFMNMIGAYLHVKWKGSGYLPNIWWLCFCRTFQCHQAHIDLQTLRNDSCFWHNLKNMLRLCYSYSPHSEKVT